MKHMGAVETDSVKSQLGKLKICLLHKACERASETCEQTLHGQEQNNAHGKPERVSSISSQHTSTITRTASPRVGDLFIFFST